MILEPGPPTEILMVGVDGAGGLTMSNDGEVLGLTRTPYQSFIRHRSTGIEYEFPGLDGGSWWQMASLDYDGSHIVVATPNDYHPTDQLTPGSDVDVYVIDLTTGTATPLGVGVFTDGIRNVQLSDDAKTVVVSYETAAGGAEVASVQVSSGAMTSLHSQTPFTVPFGFGFWFDLRSFATVQAVPGQPNSDVVYRRGPRAGSSVSVPFSQFLFPDYLTQDYFVTGPNGTFRVGSSSATALSTRAAVNILVTPDGRVIVAGDGGMWELDRDGGGETLIDSTIVSWKSITPYGDLVMTSGFGGAGNETLLHYFDEPGRIVDIDYRQTVDRSDNFAIGVLTTDTKGRLAVADHLITGGPFQTTEIRPHPMEMYRRGSPSLELGEQVVATSMAPPDMVGWWQFTDRGRVIPSNDLLAHFGDMSGVALNQPIIDAIATPSGLGYYLVALDGGVFAFGDARFYGSMGGLPLNSPVNGLAPTSTGKGYWLVADDGGIFAFGDAFFHGSMGGTILNQPVVGMVSGADGYLMFASDGGTFAFGQVSFLGSLGGQSIPAPIVGAALNPVIDEYVLADADGRVYRFGP
ncbi:MAG: hypothetical protein GY713_10365 [Actinomycetia bacterium]|nr:hypothetical protein [Actinomycetes bacterium]